MGFTEKRYRLSARLYLLFWWAWVILPFASTRLILAADLTMCAVCDYLQEEVDAVFQPVRELSTEEGRDWASAHYPYVKAFIETSARLKINSETSFLLAAALALRFGSRFLFDLKLAPSFLVRPKS
jgi:hypothetical protein